MINNPSKQSETLCAPSRRSTRTIQIVSKLLLGASLISVVHIVAASEDQFVYTVRISKRGYSDTIQTGFRLRGTKGIVTCLHGVVDGESFSAYNEEGDDFGGLKVASVDINRDLALLSGRKIEQQPPDGLDAGQLANVSPNVELVVPGHPAGVRLNRRHAKAGDPALVILKDRLPKTAEFDLGEFQARGSPNSNIQILVVSGGLGPGESGAPVLYDGAVVGVIDGGLRGYDLSWAIPIPLSESSWVAANSEARHLATLRSSTSSILFSTQASKSSSSELRAKARFVGHWIPVTSDLAQRSRARPTLTNGDITISFDENEKLNANGTFDFRQIVQSANDNVYLDGKTIRAVGSVSSMIDDIYFRDGVDIAHCSAEIKSGYWDGTNWLLPPDHFPHEEANLEMDLGDSGFLEFLTWSDTILFRKAPSPTESQTGNAESAQDNLYRVAGVDPDDTLAMRSGAGADRSVVTRIPADATDIKITGRGVQVDSDEWVPVRWQDTTGWINKRFLSSAETSD